MDKTRIDRLVSVTNDVIDQKIDEAKKLLSMDLVCRSPRWAENILGDIKLALETCELLKSVQ